MYYTHEKKIWNNFYESLEGDHESSENRYFFVDVVEYVCIKSKLAKQLSNVAYQTSVKNYYTVSEKASLIVGCS